MCYKQWGHLTVSSSKLSTWSLLLRLLLSDVGVDIFNVSHLANRDAVELKKKRRPSIPDAVVRHPRYRTGCSELTLTRGRSCFMIVYHEDLHLGSKSPRKNNGNCTGHHCCVKSTGV